MKKQQVPLGLIVTDVETQQRAIDEEMIKTYLELMQDGVEFPPVEIIRDAEKYYLWDGFHRLECTKRLEKKFIYSYVKEGTLKDAIWLSFGANKDHGFRRARGTTKAIIERILCDAKWSKISQAKIARHVGVTKGYVSIIKIDLLKKENADSESKTAKRGIVSIPLLEDESQEEKPKLQRSETVENVSATGKKYEQKSQDKQNRPPEQLFDEAKQIIPDNLRELYDERSEILSLMNRLKKIQDEILEAVEKRKLIFTYMNTNQLSRDYKAYRSQMKAALPNYVCPYCAGKGGSCKSCSGIGLLNSLKYASVIKELKAT